MKYLILLLAILSFNVLANPEIGRQLHFVTDPTNADHEEKPAAGVENCKSSVSPDGNGGARGWSKCTWITPYHPWDDIEGWNTIYANGMTLDYSTTPADCELFDFSNNAGNNQGYNVTQYNSQNWTGDHTIQTITGGYLVTLSHVCLDGVAQ